MLLGQFSIKPTVTLQHNWSPIFRGERVTLRCEIHGGGGTEWTYEWRPTSRYSETFSESRTITADSDSYSCRGRTNYEQTQWSDSFSLTVGEFMVIKHFIKQYSVDLLVFVFSSIAEKPRANLTAEETIIPAGGSITLTCSVPSSAGWKFGWFRQESMYQTAQLIRINEPDGFIRVSEEGIYSCRGGRGDPVFYTESSNKVSVRKTGEFSFCSPLKQKVISDLLNGGVSFFET
uniref:Ig-like domain-containing protein n=1 Tax=Cyprinodon variegatus TaxID=28743 RepID=A0A3Q2D1C7_CYPVA